MKSILISTCLALAITASVQAQSVLRLRGSDTLGAKRVPQWAEAFKKSNSGVSFDIAAEGSSTAFTNLAEGTAEIGMSSRKAKDEEVTLCKTKGVFLKEYNVADWDALFAVNVRATWLLAKAAHDALAASMGKPPAWNDMFKN